jgi:CBS-domain-containing membrane protein
MTVEGPNYFQKFKGDKVRSGLPYPKLKDILIAGLGGFIIISLLYLLHAEWKIVLCFIVPFGASAVLVFAAPAAPFSQPRNVIGGHLLSALVGILVMVIFKSDQWWVLAIANAVAIMVMVATKTVHPPAGATTFLPILNNVTSFTWALLPVLVGAVIIVVVGLLYNNLWAKRKYPAFWW